MFKKIMFTMLLFTTSWASAAEKELPLLIGESLHLQQGVFNGFKFRDSQRQTQEKCQITVEHRNAQIDINMSLNAETPVDGNSFISLIKTEQNFKISQNLLNGIKGHTLKINLLKDGYHIDFMYSKLGPLKPLKNGTSVSPGSELHQLELDKKLNIRSLSISRGEKTIGCRIGETTNILTVEADLMEALYSYHPSYLKTLDSETNETTRKGLVDRAKEEILVAYYIVKEEDDDAGKDFIARLLRAALERNVKVKIILDGIGFNQMSVSSHTQKMMDLLGMEFKVWRPLGELKVERRMHDKLLIADRVSMMIGSSNVWDAHAKGWLWNKDILVSGKKEVQRAVNHFYSFLNSSEVSSGKKTSQNQPEVSLDDVRLYIKSHLKVDDYNAYRSYPIIEDRFELEKTRYVHDEPVKNGLSGTTGAILNLIQSARESIDMTLIYPMLADRFKRELLLAKHRGVKIRILIPHPELILQGEHSSLYGAFLSQLPFFDLLGADMFQFSGSKGRKKFMHAKYMIVDGQKTYLGSSNFDELGSNRNTENGLITLEPKGSAFYAQSLINDFEYLIKNQSHIVSPVYSNGQRVETYPECSSIGCGMWRIYYSDLTTNSEQLLVSP